MDDEIEAQAYKFSRVGNNSINKIVSMRGCEQEEDLGDGKNTNQFQIQTSNWHNNSSRIVRASRASGGKDRHSKVMTSKGLRDRRVRLSVTTAIQFYDLQDRLGYDQPSKAVEWLIKAASDAISELPSLNTFPETPKQLSDEKRPSDHIHDQQQRQKNPNLSLSKSACSSTSETSKGSGLSLSRSEIRVKARERARKRTSKEKEKENESSIIVPAQQHHHHNGNHASFTELLTSGIGSSNSTVPTNTTNQYQWSSTMDYFSSGLLNQSSSASASSSSGQIIQLGHSHSHPVSPFSGENQSDEMQQHFPFMHENLNHSSSSCSQLSGSEYNLNFTISSSGLAGYNRGTLQSNSPSLLPQLQRFSTIDGSSTSNNHHLPFFIGSSAPTMDNNHHHLQFSPVFDGRLQLCYGDGNSLADQKGKANKN